MVTTRLLKAASEAELAQPKNFIHIVNCIREDHIQSAARYIQSTNLLESFSAQVTAECEGLMRFLEAVQTVGETSPGILDRLVSKGENLSSRFVAALLEDRGVNAQFVDLSEIIDFKSDHGLDQVFYNNVAVAFRGVVEACEDRVPVLTGYFGPVQGGLLKNIGRGYTDLCAALVAVGLQAEELQIWKEVDGIFTADPRKVPTARLLPKISPDEAAELTFYGSEVVHPFTMQQVIEASIPIRIKNVMNPRGDGTVITPEPVKAKVLGEERKLFRNRSASLLSPHQRPKRPTAVTIKHKILVLNVHSNKRSFASGYFFANVFSTLSKWGLATDLISTSQVNVSMVLHSGSALVSGVGEDEKKVIDRDLRGAIDELSQYGTVDLIDGMAILSLVGKQLKNNVGIAGKMFSALGDNNVNIEMISQGLFAYLYFHLRLEANS